jgi:hypothetical protein
VVVAGPKAPVVAAGEAVPTAPAVAGEAAPRLPRAWAHPTAQEARQAAATVGVVRQAAVAAEPSAGRVQAPGRAAPGGADAVPATLAARAEQATRVARAVRGKPAAEAERRGRPAEVVARMRWR